MNNKIIFFALFLASTQVSASDANQYILESFPVAAEMEKEIKGAEDDGIHGFFPGNGQGIEAIAQDDDEASQTHHLPRKEFYVPEPQDRDKALDRGQKISGDKEIPQDHLIQANDRQLFKSTARTQSSSFSFYYVRDDFDVSDGRGIYNQTYVNDTSAVRGGTLMFSWEKTFLNSWVNLAWGLNAGVGLSQGTGRFVDGTVSDAKFSLWNLPLELGLSLELPVATWFDLYVEAGPGVLGLIQNRSDYERGADGKRRRQIGTGYYAEAKFKLSLSNIFRKTGFSFFSEYGVSNATLDFIARMQDYGNFQDDISITGQSIGVGFTFDYL